MIENPNEYQLVDARPSGRFKGTDPEPRPGLSSGHMPNAINVPFPEIMDPLTKKLLSKEDLMKLFQSKGVDLEKPVITTCGSGVTACMLYFALEYIGCKNISVYDGSWTEYASRPESKIVKEN